MKKIVFFIVLPLFFISMSCSDGTEKKISDGGCTSNSDCPANFECDPETKKCVPVKGNDENDILPTNDDDPVKEDKEMTDIDNIVDDDEGEPDDTVIETECEPGEEEECPYEGPPETKNIGECKGGTRVCGDDGTWGFCSPSIIPVYETGELCDDGKDHACVGTPDTGWDEDGDGVPSCLDCCESSKDCPDPKSAWDVEKHFCSFDEADHDSLYECGDEIPEGTKNPVFYAKAMGICPEVTEESGEWGLISASILLPDETEGAHNDSHNILSGLGDNITPLHETKLLALSSGEAIDPFPDEHRQWTIKSQAPSDWLAANDGNIPNAPICPEISSTEVNDPVMLKMELRVPAGVKSFSFNIYFLSMEFPNHVCTTYNDFFVVLLDSTYNSVNPDSELKNPTDKNLAMAPGGYPVGVNMAKMEDSDLFTVCEVSAEWPACLGTDDLIGTGGFLTGLSSSSLPENKTPRGGTGWLTVRGNVVADEVVTLRMAIWDTDDHIFDSMVLIDNFRWQFEEYTPGVEK
jgi:hypothetical protein